jgi:signal transduction histidine kinase/DNA-binding response OmpR family regulator
LIISASSEERAVLVEHVLRAAGYTIAEARHFDEARAMLASFRPHAIVLDADQNVDDVRAFLAEHEAATPIIVTTAQRSLDHVLALSAAGAFKVVVKPFERDRLLDLIGRGVRMSKAIHEYEALREQTERQGQEFNALYTVGRKITALLDTEEILATVVTAAVNLTRAEEGALMLLDAATGELYLRASRNFAEATAHRLRAKVTDTLMGRVIQSGRPIMMTGNDLVKIQSAFLVKAILGVPLMAGDRVTGVLSVDNRRSGRQFSEHEVHLLSTLADSAAIAIETAQLYQDARRRANELAALIEIDRHISSTLDLTVVLERIATHAQALLKADDSEVYLLEPDQRTLRAIVARGHYPDEIMKMALRLGEGIVGDVAQRQAAEMINNAQDDPRSKHVPGTPDVAEAMMCAALTSKGELLGAMVVVRAGEHPPFAQSELDFLKGLAGQAAIAIDNARMYATERQRALELVRALEQQRDLDRMKNEFIQNISHELRTPLSIVRGYAELLEQGDLGDLPPAQRESISVMARRSRMLSKMLDDLLTILAAETRKMVKEVVDLTKLIESMLLDFQPAAKQAGVTLSADIAPDVPMISGDPVHLRRVIDNLVGNALKFTPSGGRVLVCLAQAGGNVVLEVSDTGIGIPPEQQPRIFDRFYQIDGSTTRRYGGVGLGLALVKEIVESHGGRVSVMSREGQGSTFRVILPAMASRDEG